MEATTRTNTTNAVAAHIEAMTDELGARPEDTEAALVAIGATEDDLDAIAEFAHGDSPFESVGELVEHLDCSND